jgi:arginine utilization protein RocB
MVVQIARQAVVRLIVRNKKTPSGTNCGANEVVKMERFSVTGPGASRARQDAADDDQRLAKDFQDALKQNANGSSSAYNDEAQRSVETTKESDQAEAIGEKKAGASAEDPVNEILALLKDRADDKEKDKGDSTGSKSVEKEMFTLEKLGKKATFELTISSQTKATENGETVNEDFSLRRVKLELDDKLLKIGGVDIGLPDGF